MGCMVLSSNLEPLTTAHKKPPLVAAAQPWLIHLPAPPSLVDFEAPSYLHQPDVLNVRSVAEVSHLEGLAVITPTSAPRAVACPDVVPSFITKGLTIACRSPNRV